MADLYPQQHRESARAWLRDVLVAATRDRHGRHNVVITSTGPEMGWVVHERQVMLDATNSLRADVGLPPVDLAVIERIDRSAAGHVDWLDKFVLRCAELAVGENGHG